MPELKLTKHRARVLKAIADGQVEYSQFTGCMNAAYRMQSNAENVTSAVHWLVQNRLVIPHGLGIKAGNETTLISELGRKVLPDA